MFWLCADAGMGKSAFMSALWSRLYRGSLLGVFFCRFNDVKRSDAIKVVESLAFQIANTTLPECRDDIYQGAEVIQSMIKGGQKTAIKDYFTHLLQIPPGKVPI